MAKMDLSPLVIAAQQGDEQALSDLLEASYRDLYFYAYQTVKNEDLAADITQESCLEILSTISQLREPNAFVVWARRITYHQCTRFFRESKEITVEANEDGETVFDRIVDERDGVLPEQVQLDKEFRATMQQLLDELPAQQRTALMLYYYEKLSVGQIAQIQDTTEGTVKSRLNYGRKAVKAKVEEYEKKTGTRLHSIAPLPLLLFFLFGKQHAEALASASLGAVRQIVSGSVAAGAGTAAAGTAAGASAVIGTATTGAASAVGTSLGVKIAAGAVAAAVCIGGAVGGAALIENATAKVPKELRGTWYGEQYTEEHPSDVLILEADGTLQYHGYTFVLDLVEQAEDDATGKDMELYFQYETTRPDCGECTHSGVHLSFDWLDDSEHSKYSYHESTGYLISVYPTIGQHANGEEAIAPFFTDPADAHILFHHYYQKEPPKYLDIWGQWTYEAGSSPVKSFTIHPDHRLTYGGETYIWKLTELWQGTGNWGYCFTAYPLTPQSQANPCCLHKSVDRVLYLDIILEQDSNLSATANLDEVSGVGATYIRSSGTAVNTGPAPTESTTEMTTGSGFVIPSQFLGQWETFPDEEGISSYYASNGNATFQIYDTTYYVLYAEPSTLLLAKEPDLPPYLATAQLVFHADTFGIPAIELQKLYPDDDKEPRTLDYFWRSADLAQTEAVTLTNKNWQLYIAHSLGDRSNSMDTMIQDNGNFTYFYFYPFISEGSWAEGTLLRKSFLHRSYMEGTQGYIDNIPGSEYPSELPIRLDGRFAEMRVSNIPDGASGGQVVYREVNGENVRYYEQFSLPAELQNVTGTVYIPRGFDAEAWLAVND